MQIFDRIRIENTWPSRGFLAGLALTAPYIANPVPIWFAFLFLIPLIFDIFLRGLRLRPLFTVTPILLCLYALALLNILAIWTTPFPMNVISPLVWSGGIIGIVLLASDERDNPGEIVKGFVYSVAIVSSVIGAAGLTKYMLELNGYIFGFMVNTCFGRYPQGTTFCGDYNIYSLFMLTGAIGVSVYLFSKKRSVIVTALCILALSIVITSGFFAGSRRFYFVVPLLPALWIAFAVWGEHAKRTLVSAFVVVVLASSLYVTFSRDYTAPNREPQIIERVLTLKLSRLLSRLGPERLGSGHDEISTRAPEDYLAPRAVAPDVMATTMTSASAYGFDTRLDRWRYGIELVAENGYVRGSGFDYHQKFSCRFVDCEFIDYPHAPIISSWIAFGVLGLILAGLFYFLTLLNLLASGRFGVLSGASMVTLAAMPFSLISGDMIFSLPHAVIAALLVDITVRAQYHPEPQNGANKTRLASLLGKAKWNLLPQKKAA